MKPPSIQTVIARLLQAYGPPSPPPVTNPLEMILWENVAYLADDDRRLQAFCQLEESVGLQPHQILAATDEDLYAAARFGIVPDQTVVKLRTIAEIAANEFPDGVESALGLPLKQAMRELKKFPAIGDPAAEKILLFTRTYPVPALDSNGLRVLQRVGFGTDTSRYASDYKAVQKDAFSDASLDCDFLCGAHTLLRRHGKEVCRRSTPYCGGCSLVNICGFGRKTGLMN